MTSPGTSDDGRFGGVAMWRRIADAIRLDIVGGKLPRGQRLPGELALAARFGVNRHTVRHALGVLEQEGIVRTEHGRGTFVERSQRLSYPISKRTRFREGIGSQAGSLEQRLLAHAEESAPAHVARALTLSSGAKLVRIETLAIADGKPLSRATHWLDARRFADFPARFGEHGGMTGAFTSFGVADYQRASTRISARHADTEETALLELGPAAILLVSEAVDVDPEGVPVQYALSRFPADRLELVV